jgi:hypothetical protein
MVPPKSSGAVREASRTPPSPSTLCWHGFSPSSAAGLGMKLVYARLANGLTPAPSPPIFPGLMTGKAVGN